MSEETNIILFANVPKHSDLCCIVATINSGPKKDANKWNNDYHRQILKCRCLIFTEPEVIASPVLGAIKQVYVVVSQKFYKSGKLNYHMEKLNMKAHDPMPVTNTVYESCLRYTFLARLAPNWNQVDKYLIQGRDFLLATSPLNAVRLDIVITENDMHIVVWAVRLSLPQIQLEDFIPPHYTISLTNLNSQFVWDLSCGSHFIHVLPSLNKARAVMLSGKIPESSAFKSYKDLKRHWKNNYGYRLPDTEEGMIYLTVTFGGRFGGNLTYPIVCVRSGSPVFLRQRTQQDVLLDLLADLNSKVSHVCGHPFGVESQFRYAIPKLNSLSEGWEYSNITSIQPTKKYVKKDIQDEQDPSQSQPVSLYIQQTQHDPSQLPIESEPEEATPKGRHFSDYQKPKAKRYDDSPPPFMPYISQNIKSQPLQPMYAPVFTPKPKTPIRTQVEPTSTRLMFTSALRHYEASPVIERPKLHTPVVGSFQNHSDKSKKSESIKRPAVSQGDSQDSFKCYSYQVAHHPVTLSEGVVKKARSKPQVQMELDVPVLAQCKDGLNKANTATLIAYLRNQGVSCKVKDKKIELINKVMTHLNLPTCSNTMLSQQETLLCSDNEIK